MLIQLLQVPYDSGHAATRMGRGPEHLVDRGAMDRLHAAGHRVQAVRVEPGERFPAEISTAFELSRRLARQVLLASNQKRFPLVLAGNCFSALGTVAGLSRGGPVGVVWLDAHADLNTPESSTSAMLDGMALATCLGLCWGALAESVPGFRPLPPEHVLLAGARSIDPAERELMARLNIAHLPSLDRESALEAALDALRSRVGRVYLHLDLDVLDPVSVAPANALAPPAGASTERVLATIRAVRERFAIAAAGLTAYDPAHDRGDRVLDAALAALEALTDHPR